MLKTLDLKDAVGHKLAHDITEIRPGEFKGPASRRGHTVCEANLCHLQRLGKNHLYVIDLAEDEIHENEAAVILATALAGDGIVWTDGPREGKISLLAGLDGLLAVDVAALAAFNMVDEVMCASLHNHTLVKEGDLVAGTRAIPLVMKRAPIERAAAIARQNGAVLSVRPGVVDTEMQALLRREGPKAMAPEQVAYYQSLKTEGKLEPPAVPARSIAWLSLHAPREWSGQFLNYDDPQIMDPSIAVFGEHLEAPSQP